MSCRWWRWRCLQACAGRNMGGGRCFCFRQVGLWDAFSERCFNGPPRGQWPRFRFWVFGGLEAANAQLSLRTMTVLAGLLGLAHGWLNGAGVPWSCSLVGVYAGLVGGIFVVVALVSAFVIKLRPPWARIAVQVAGSWIVASGLLLLGWTARRG